VIAALLVAGGVALAQEPSGEARELAERARVAAEEGRLAEARTLLEAALREEPSPAFAFNLALVLEPMGELVATDALLERLLDGEFGALAGDRRARVEEFRAEVRASLATLDIRTRGSDVEVRVDGVLRGRTEEGRLSIAIDPGERQLELVAGSERASRAISIRAGERREVELPIGAAVADRIAIDHDPPLDDGDTAWESPWLWTVIGVLALGGAGIAIGFAIAGGNEALPSGFLGEAETLLAF
jgi:hypothetical protein